MITLLQSWEAISLIASLGGVVLAVGSYLVLSGKW